VQQIAEFSGSVGEQLHRYVERGGAQGGFFRRFTCQVLPLSRLGERAQSLDAPVDKLRDWQEKHELNLLRSPKG
jgi:hypothetical protein